ncbi:MAG: type II secretion system F family protein [Alphaproteobacteria bacterium]|nr:MAG: type II secretion system F family protein [Alphaproteobacteria bacterium]
MNASLPVWIALSVFVTIALLVFAIAAIFFGQDATARRMKEAQKKGLDPRGQTSLSQDNRLASWSKLLSPIDRRVGPKDKEVRSTARKQLIKAGFYNPSAVEIYFALRVLLALLLPFLGLVLVKIAAPSLTANVVLLIVIGGTVFGYFLPFLLVHNQIENRQQAVRDGLPDALDLLLICIDAGSSLASGFKRVGEEMESVHSVVAEQMTLISFELQAGVGRSEALRNFAERVDIDEVHSLTTLLIQSEQLGTSLARAMRVYAAEMRSNRMLDAEERGNKLPVKLALPLVLFILPSLMLTIMTPLIIRIFRVLLQT